MMIFPNLRNQRIFHQELDGCDKFFFFILFFNLQVSPQSTFYWPLIVLIISFVAGVNFYLAVRIIFAIITDCDCYLMVFTFLIASFSGECSWAISIIIDYELI